MSKLFNWWSVRNDNSEEHQGDWKEGCHSKIGPTNELHVPINSPDVGRECVEGLDRASNQCYEHENDGDVVELECEGEPLRPCPMRVASSDDSLGEDQVDDEEDKYSCVDEDLGSDSDRDIARVARPDYPHSHGGDSGHAETKDKRRHDKLLLSSQVDLENGHVGCSAQDEQSQKDGTNWIIEGFRGLTTKPRVDRDIWGAFGSLRLHLLASIVCRDRRSRLTPP